MVLLVLSLLGIVEMWVDELFSWDGWMLMMMDALGWSGFVVGR